MNSQSKPEQPQKQSQPSQENQKICTAEDNVEDCLDLELDTTFPASDPVAIAQPHSQKEVDRKHDSSPVSTQ